MQQTRWHSIEQTIYFTAGEPRENSESGAVLVQCNATVMERTAWKNRVNVLIQSSGQRGRGRYETGGLPSVANQRLSPTISPPHS